MNCLKLAMLLLALTMPACLAERLDDPCDAPASTRLKANGDGTFHDKLLNIDCSFFKAEGHGKLCLPVWTHQNGTNGFGNSDFPEATATVNHQSSDCQSNQIFWANQGPFGDFPKYGFTMASADSVSAVFNLRDPDPTTVTSTDPKTGKATGISDYYSTADCIGPKTAKDQQNGFFMIADGQASIPACPYMTGLGLFAGMPQ